MEQKFGYYILFGFILGIILGVFWERSVEDTSLFIVFSAFGGLFMGGFIATMLLNRNGQKKDA